MSVSNVCCGRLPAVFELMIILPNIPFSVENDGRYKRAKVSQLGRLCGQNIAF